MAWDSGSFHHSAVGAAFVYVPVNEDVAVYPWNPRLITSDTRIRAKSGDLWSYRHYQTPGWTLRFVDVGSTCVNMMGSYVRFGTDSIQYRYAGNVYAVMPPEGYVFAPQADGPDSWSFDLPLESIAHGTLELMS